MCGINAQFGSLLWKYSNSLKHRGPDEHSIFRLPQCEVEFSRLSITGKDDGKSPVFSSDGRWACFLNGEIYNFRKLQISHSLPFTNSDTQVIADGLSKFGIGFLSKLRGMFACVALDLDSQEYFVFRDPLGEKPLFTYTDENGVYISSEFMSLKKNLQSNIDINYAAVADFFRFGYHDEPATFDNRIKSFPPGAVQRINIEDRSFEPIMSLTGFDNSETGLRLSELIEVILDESLESQVPTGLALSSGIDSTSLLYAKYLRGNPEFTPLIIDLIENPAKSEAFQAIDACNRIGIQPIIIRKNSDSIATELLTLAVANDQPHADFSGISYLRLFEAAKQNGLKVMIMGHGPDELFWGYPWNFPRKRSPSSRFKGLTQRNFNPDPYFWNTPALARKLTANFNFRNSRERNFGSQDIYLESNNLWQRSRGYQVRSYLTGNGLRQTDRLSMFHGVEARTPFADSRLYGWVQENCVDSKTNLPDKILFRQNLELGPLNDVRNRNKLGFRSDYDNWFLNQEVEDLLNQAIDAVDDLNLPLKSGISELKLSVAEKYRVLMLGLWLRNIT